MEGAEIEDALARLEATAEPRVARFAGEAPLRRLAVLPSAFNPPTRAHLRLLELGAEALGADTRGTLLSTRNVDKDLDGASLPHRVGMLLAARAAGHPVTVLATNAARFVDQAAALRAAFAEVPIDFVAGFDTLVRIFEPRYYAGTMTAELEAFFAAHRLLATNRAEATLDEVWRFLEAPHVRPFADRVIVRELEPEAARLSSTQARDSALLFGAPRGVPVAVARYIAEHGLYRLPISDSRFPIHEYPAR